jgi:hypothetical protein
MNRRTKSVTDTELHETCKDLSSSPHENHDSEGGLVRANIAFGVGIRKSGYKRLGSSSDAGGIMDHAYPAPHSSRPTTNVVIAKESKPKGPGLPNLVKTGAAT